jgi:hypothetical protein
VCIYHIFFVDSSAGLLDWFHNLGIVSSGGVNLGVKVSLLHSDLYSNVYMPGSDTAGWHGNYTFSCLGSLHTDFHRGLHSHQWCISIPFFPISLSEFIVLCFIDDSHTDWSHMKSQCFICISFMPKNFEHFFMNLLADCLFNSFAQSLFGYLFFWSLIILDLYVFADINIWWIPGKDFLPFCMFSLDSGNCFLYAEIF